jgi:uncharacterized protein (TIGR01319 family)
MAFEQVNSFLVGDIGNVHTRLVLIDLVEGQYRLITSARAHTTAQPPLGKVSLGLDHAAQNITDLIGRELVSADSDQLFLTPESGGHGVDMFVATGSAGRPMRVFLVGLTPEVSMLSGRRVLAGSYVTVTDMLCPDDLRSEEEQINAILNGEPDMILIVGGTDDGADDILIDMTRKVERALSLIKRGTMPSVLFAGNKSLRRHIKDLLGEHTNVFVAKNVRPAFGQEQLFPAQIELALVYDDYRSKSPGGFDEVGRYSQVGVVPTTQGYISAVRYLCELPGRGIGPLCIDVGSANSAVVAAVHKEPHYTIRTDLGVGHNAVDALKAVTPERLVRWLPFNAAVDDLWDYMVDKQLRPATLPGTPEELMVEQALAREIIRLLVAEARPAWGAVGGDELLPEFRPIIAAGAILTEAQHPGISALLLLDALQPTGQVELRLDPHNLVSALGVVAYLKPIVTVQAFEAGGLVNLGTAFCPLGHIRRGRDAMRVQVRLPDGQVLKRIIRSGDIWAAPVLPGVTADVIVRLARGLSIDGRRRIRRRVVAGTAGILFDARGRPLVMPRPKERAVRFMEWQNAAMGRERRARLEAEVEPLPSVDDLLAETDPLSDLEQEQETADAVLS